MTNSIGHKKENQTPFETAENVFVSGNSRHLAFNKQTTKRKLDSPHRVADMKIKVTIEMVINTDELTNWPQGYPAVAAIKYIDACLDGNADWPSKLEIKAEEVKK